MTVLVTFIFLCLYAATITYILVALARLRRARRMDRHINEALRLAHPIGPEDEDSWGLR